MRGHSQPGTSVTLETARRSPYLAKFCFFCSRSRGLRPVGAGCARVVVLVGNIFVEHLLCSGLESSLALVRRVPVPVLEELGQPKAYPGQTCVLKPKPDESGWMAWCNPIPQPGKQRGASAARSISLVGLQVTEPGRRLYHDPCKKGPRCPRCFFPNARVRGGKRH